MECPTTVCIAVSFGLECARCSCPSALHEFQRCVLAIKRLGLALLILRFRHNQVRCISSAFFSEGGAASFFSLVRLLQRSLSRNQVAPSPHGVAADFIRSWLRSAQIQRSLSCAV